MSKSDRILPPGPNPREDQMTEKDQRQLRSQHRSKSRHEEEPSEERTLSQAEGERSGEPSHKVKGTPGQAEGSRETVEHELRAREEKDE